ncbi:MAG: septum site-determining protein MinC [Bacilli bacterium]|nr:septum site-determining protein MinC [Bacilli bacterium]
MSRHPDNETVWRQGHSPVTIKGSRIGLTFILHPQFSMEEVLADLKEKLTGKQAHLFSGPTIQVIVSTGDRELSESDIQSLRDVFRLRKNLTLGTIGSLTSGQAEEPSGILMHETANHYPKVHYGTVRSGMRLEHYGDIVVVGDVNPGGQIIAGGNIVVMGTLRGMAHAGCFGDEQSIIAAVYFMPTQIRIANVISRSPDGEPKQATEMEFAYLLEGQMAVDKLQHLSNILM